ncbi:MAG TPA: 2-oxoacid:ferredoxin oxidoreductase subunit beta, partial [Firmicutes bacterium]|nr:2-oxoacid:ferredoxin oxidoreductase subunit beta [Bacillota bacterium]
MIRAIAKMGWSRDEVVVVTGIGCSARSNAIIDFNTFQTTHGRALGFATGLKLARPELKVIVVTGDGDGAGIGGNHLIHAARR